MELSTAEIALMSRLLDEALELDDAGRHAWLESLSPEHRSLAPALRAALLKGAEQEEVFRALATPPKFDSGAEPDAAPTSGLQAGVRLGPYELIRLLGAGGMAEVWLARRADGAFKREVALKLPTLSRFRADLEPRFARERDILASLEDPHIARFYDAGVDPNGLPYLAMEYVQGQPLTSWSDAQHLGIPARLELFLQVLAAVQYAHERQVIHGDLKPSNMLVMQSGQVRLLDFGIAKLLEPEVPNQMPLTGIYGRALTPDYASPEQLMGDPVDARSDIYCLGILLYELLIGARPYRIKSGASTGLLEQAIGAIDLRKPSAQLRPEALAARGATVERLARELRGDLDAITLKALARSPADRYQSAISLAEDLRCYLDGKPVRAQRAGVSYRLRKFVQRNKPQVIVSALALIAVVASVGYTLYRETKYQVTVSASAAGKPATALAVFAPAAHSLAVLPFTNLSGDASQEYFSDGLSEELINALSRIRALEVAARTSSFSFKGQTADIETIARKLNVAAVLEGSVRRSGNTVRVTAQLINATNGFHIWSQTYDREVRNILALQTDIATMVAQQLQVKLLGDEATRIGRSGTHNPEAYDAYLRGLQAANLRTRDGFSRSIAEFSRAVTLDPGYALAHAALANAFALAPVFGGARFTETMPKAKQAALRAIQLDDSVPLAHTTLAFVEAHYEYNWAAAEQEFRRALELSPSDAYAHFFYSNGFLSPFGRHDEAIAQMRIAAKLDPLSIPIQAFVGRTFLWARRYDEALLEFEKAERMNPNVALVHERLAHLYTYTGAYEKAISEETKARVLSGESAEAALSKEGELRAALSADGARGYWQKVLNFSRSADNPPEAYTTSYGRAIVFARLGEYDNAFAELDQAYAQRELALTESGVEPALDPLHGDPRFLDMLQRINLAPSMALLAR
jgi:TolB-like protein/serine/threonine protein kinase